MTLTRSSNVKRFIFPNGKSSNDRVLFHQPRNVYLYVTKEPIKMVPKKLDNFFNLPDAPKKDIRNVSIFFNT